MHKRVVALAARYTGIFMCAASKTSSVATQHFHMCSGRLLRHVCSTRRRAVAEPEVKMMLRRIEELIQGHTHLEDAREASLATREANVNRRELEAARKEDDLQ